MGYHKGAKSANERDQKSFTQAKASGSDGVNLN